MIASRWPEWLDDVWAKSAIKGAGSQPESLAQHTWEVISRLSEFIRLRPDLPESLGVPRLWQILFWAAFLHDFGKATSGFQTRLRGGERWPHRHEVISLAFVDWGSALAPIRLAHRNKKNILVYVNETRPRSQGAKLTAWELLQENILHVIIPDTAAGYYISQKEIDLIIVGADRIAANGDTANKIGTYTLAVLAKENNTPFYIAAPLTTFDPETPN